jgi:hypothetical protein
MSQKKPSRKTTAGKSTSLRPVKPAVDEYGGFIIVFNESVRAKKLEEFARKDYHFTEAVSAPDWESRQLEIALLSFDGNAISWAALLTRGSAVVSLKNRVKFSMLFHFQPIYFEELETAIGNDLRPFATISASGTVKRLPPRLWRLLISAIRKRRPDMATSFDELDRTRRIKESGVSSPEYQRLIQERDAVQIAVRIFGVTDELEKPYWAIPDSSYYMSFLEHINQDQSIEDRMIEHDAIRLLGPWSMDHVTGAAIFRKPGNRMVVLNVNRDKIERALGVDLIYYNERYEALTLVQYKRMTESGGMVAFWLKSDSNFQKELDRMIEFSQGFISTDQPRELQQYRLHAGSCFFKFCPTNQSELLPNEMIKGMYLPMDYLQLLINVGAVGPRGGRVLTYDNAGRWMSNTLFIHLVQEGWIGSRLRHPGRLAEFIKNRIHADRSVIFAAASPEHDSSKKSLGQFKASSRKPPPPFRKR